MVNIPRWLWKQILKTYTVIRLMFFTKKRTKTDYFIVRATEEELEAALGKQFFTHDWEFSYNYRGEDVNMRRPLYKDDEYKWYQLHIRGFKTEKGIEVQAHTELEPSEHPHGHLRGKNLSRKEGTQMLEDVLIRSGLEYINGR